MRFLVSVMLVLVALAGCADPADSPRESNPTPTPTPGVQQFGGTGAAPAAPPGTPRFHYTGFSGAEPNIGITSAGNIYVTAFDDTIKSSDGGVTWTSVYNYDLIQGQVERGTNDPMLWVDTVTDRIYTNHMLGTQCFTMIWSDDEGATWFQRDAACTVPVVDHQKVLTSKPGPQSNPQSARLGTLPGQYPNVVYTCYNAAVGNQCFASFDGGYTYTQEAVTMSDYDQFGPQAACSGVAGHPAAAADGTIAIAAGWNCGPSVSVSLDSGLTWSTRPGPQQFGVGASIDPDITFTADGAMFLFYRDGAHMARVARSHDLGATWDGVWNVTAPGLTSTRFHVISSGDDGHVALAYLGTDMPRGWTWTDAAGANQTWEGAPIDAPPDTAWHLYIVTSEDADGNDPTWTSYKVTPDDDPVQKGCAWEGGGGGGTRSCRNMLDFIDSAVHPDGTFYVTYTEGCTYRSVPACAGNWTAVEENVSRDREAAVAALDGWSLYATDD